MSSRGFTLIEFMLVVAIFLMLAGMASAFFGRFLLQDAVSETTDRLASSLRTAQGFTLSGKGGIPWGVAIDGSSMVLFRGTSFVARDSAFDRKVSIPPNVSIDGFTETIFSPVSGAPGIPLIVSINASGGVSRTLRMNEFGAVSRE